jgi:uncharacterized repeat protein (TIGR01451 family)
MSYFLSIFKLLFLSLLLLEIGRLRLGWVWPTTMALTLLIPPVIALADNPLPIGPEFQVNTYTTNSQNTPSVAMDADGDFVVVWLSSGQDSSGTGIYGQRYTASGVPQGSEFRVNTYTTDLQLNPSVAMDADGDFVVVWQSLDQDGSEYGVYGQRYSATGVVQGDEFRVNTYTTSIQRFASVAMDADGDFVVVWESFGQEGSNLGVYAQRYNASGIPQGNEFRANTNTTGNYSIPSVAMDASGNFVIAWGSYGQDGSEWGVYAKQYNASGVAQGPEFKVNTYTIGAQHYPSVAMDADGDFVIAWSSDDQDGSSVGIYSQRYDISGTPQGSEFQVNTYTTNVQGLGRVRLDADGDFVIVWHSTDQDGSSDGVYAQKYYADGVAQGLEFRVNTYITDIQQFPTVAMDADGNFVVVWHSSGQDGSSHGVYGQRFGVSQPTLSLIKTVSNIAVTPGQRITYTLTISNSGLVNATNSRVSDMLPTGLIFAGPVQIEPPGAGTLGAGPPILVSGLTITSLQRVTVTFPVTVSQVLSTGTIITNTAGVTSMEVITLQTGGVAVTVGGSQSFYLPVIIKDLQP